jgi:hypothetical protein
MIAKVLILMSLPAFFLSEAAWSVPSVLTEGTYAANLSPGPDERTARGIEAEFGKVPGVGSVHADTKSAAVEFTVKPGARVKTWDIENAVYDAKTNVILLTPRFLATLPK